MAAIAVDAVSANAVQTGAANETAATMAITIAAGATYAVVFVEASIQGGFDDMGIAFADPKIGTKRMYEAYTLSTQARSHSGAGTHGFVTAFVCPAPPTGAQTVSVTPHHGISGSVMNLNAFAVSFTGAVSGYRLVKGNGVNVASLTLNSPISMTANDLLIAACVNGTATPTVTTGTSDASQAGDTSTASHAGIRVAHNTGTGTVSVVFGTNNTDSSGAVGIMLIQDGEVPPSFTITQGNKAGSTTSNASVACDCGDAFTVGDLIVAVIAADNNGTLGAASLSTVTDAKSNVYTLVQATYDPGAAAAGQTICIAYARVKTAMVTTDQVTVSFSPNTTAKCIAIWRVHPDTGGGIEVTASGTTAGSGTGTPTVTSGSVPIGGAVIAALAAESTGDALVADKDTTSGDWSYPIFSAGTTGTIATSSMITSQYKVPTAAATQAYNPTLTSCDNLLAWIVLVPVIVKPTVMVQPVAAVQRAASW